MYTQINQHEFIDAFAAYNRMENFQRDGLLALYEYLTDLEQDTGETYELDVIALCCDFTRFDSIADYNAQYNTNYDSMDDVDEFACQINDDAFICYAH
jgi:hypothetical protein